MFAQELQLNMCSLLCSDNYIGGMGAVVLANALKQNSGLRELHIKGNELGDSGTTAICDAIRGWQRPIRTALLLMNTVHTAKRTDICTTAISQC